MQFYHQYGKKMKRMKIFGMIILLSMILSYTASAHVILDYPIGGETFTAGETIRIEWHLDIPHDQLDWDLNLSVDGGDTWESIVLDIDTAKTFYYWTVPAIDTQTGRIQVVQDNTGPDYYNESDNFTIRTAAGLEDDHVANPNSYKLYDNYPNPFNPATTIEYTVRAYNHTPQNVDLSIYNSLGQKITTLVSGKKEAGRHQVEWDASGFSSGVYFYKLRAGEFVAVKKMVLMR